MQLKDIKKVLMTGHGKISIGPHTRMMLAERGYSKGDIVAAIFNGEIIERQGAKKVAIAGRDMDDNPIVIIIAKLSLVDYKVVTVMPPIDQNRFKDCI